MDGFVGEHGAERGPQGSLGSGLATGEGHAEARDLRLLVTAHFVFTGRVGGAEHMLYNLVRGLATSGTRLSLLCADEANLDAGFVRELRSIGPDGLIACGGRGPRFIAEQWASLRPGLEADAILFPNYFVPPVVPRRLGRVATVMHDMQYRHFPQYFAPKKRAWLGASQRLAMRRADTVIAISDFVARDLLVQYGRQFERKIVTIPNPISWERFGAGEGSARPLAKPYVLSVAAQYAHKNLDVVVRAFAQIAKQEPELQLVFCGQSYDGLTGVAGQRRGLRPLAEELGLAGRVHMTGYVDDMALGGWFRHAEMFAFPSVFEGFGMPPVEALGFGLPTLTTRCTALPETTLGLAHYLDDPFSADEWARRMLTMVRDPAAHRPTPAEVARLRALYSPAVVGRQYAEACLG